MVEEQIINWDFQIQVVFGLNVSQSRGSHPVSQVVKHIYKLVLILTFDWSENKRSMLSLDEI